MVDPSRHEWVRQTDLRGDANDVSAWARDHPEAFAGIWFDNHSDDDEPLRSRLGVGVVGDIARFERELRDLVRSPNALTVVRMRWTHVELDAFRDKAVNELLLQQSPEDSDVIGVGADPQLNRVVAQLRVRNDDLAADIIARFGTDVVVIEQPPTGTEMLHTGFFASPNARRSPVFAHAARLEPVLPSVPRAAGWCTTDAWLGTEHSNLTRGARLGGPSG